MDSALSRLVAAGRIRRIARGLYDLPRTNPRLGPLAPSVDAVVKAVADRDRVQPTGAYAANTLGLTTQSTLSSTASSSGSPAGSSSRKQLRRFFGEPPTLDAVWGA